MAMKLDSRLNFLNDPFLIIPLVFLVIIMFITFIFTDKKGTLIKKVKPVQKETILPKKEKELSSWRYRYYEHLYYTN